MGKGRKYCSCIPLLWGKAGNSALVYHYYGERQEILLLYTVMISVWTGRSEQTVKIQIRLLREGQSGQGLHCLPSCLHLLNALLYGKATLFV